MYFHEQQQAWTMKFDPMVCASSCQNIGGICSFTKKPISSKRGNVFYDIHIEYIRHDGTLFDGEIVKSVRKGVRLFDTNRSLTICEHVAKHCQSEIIEKVNSQYHSEIFLHNLKVTVQNIRCEARESRDLLQDLEDAKNGISISYDSDIRKGDKLQKKIRKAAANDKKKKRLMKILLDPDRGYASLEEYSVDYIHANKWFSDEELATFEHERQQKIREITNQPIQLSLF